MAIEEIISVLDDMKVKIDIPKAAVMQNNKNYALDVAIETMCKYQKIKEIVKKWELDSWTDNLSYESMIQIREVLEDGNDD